MSSNDYDIISIDELIKREKKIDDEEKQRELEILKQLNAKQRKQYYKLKSNDSL